MYGKTHFVFSDQKWETRRSLVYSADTMEAKQAHAPVH